MPTASRIGLCLALGALTTLVVAWVLAVHVVVPVGPFPYGFGVDSGTWLYCVHLRPGLTVVVRERGRGPLVFPNGEIVAPVRLDLQMIDGTRAFASATFAPDDIPAWARQPRVDPAVNPSVVTAASARGWPCRALWYEATMSPGTRVNRGGIDLPPTLRDLGPGPVLPCRVIAAGFAADTALFGAAWLLLLPVPGVVRRVTRHRRGWCIECGYDLRHAGHDRCPECGAVAQDDERWLHPLVLKAWASRSTSP